MQPLSALFIEEKREGESMSRQLKARPLSKAKIHSILSQKVSAEASPANSSPVVMKPAAPKFITLKRQEEFDSLQPEENLKTFLAFARNVIARYEDDQRLQTDLETETQDLLHLIELSPNMNACEYTKKCIKLRDVRRQRRACKNEIDLLKPLYDYLSDKTLINQLSQLQGKCKTSKEVISQRQYTLRTDVME